MKRRPYKNRRKVIRRNRKPFYRKGAFWFSFLSLIIISGLSYVSLFSPYFQIKETAVLGTQTISKEELLNAFKDNSVISLNVLGNNLTSESLFLPLQNNISSMMENFPEIEDINIKKNFFTQKITIEVKEKTPICIWCADGSCVLLDKKATYIKDYESEVGFIKINEIEDYESNLKLWSGQTKDDFIMTLLTVYKNNEEIKEFNVEADKFLGIYKNINFIFDPKEDINWQIEKMNIALKRLNYDVEGLRYIDLRFGEQVIVK
ncbi:MAG: hypothetical protein PHG24_01535 [Candidatus Pacebacteria bacterium]|nr:hypothetical protein [Candidatus Paceibacterota bacterium]